MKVTIAQISTSPGKIKENTGKIIDIIKKTKTNILVFPELCIPGYMSLDLFLNKRYIDENIKALNAIKKHVKDKLVIIGFVDKDKNNNYNAAAIIKDKKIIKVYHKRVLPEYDIFFEKRYFKEGKRPCIFNYKTHKIGIEICEDMWKKDDKITKELIDDGVDTIINISSSPYEYEKFEKRTKIIKDISKIYNINFIYCNLVGLQDAYYGENIFDGKSLIYDNNGNLIRLGKSFEEDIFSINLSKKNKTIIHKQDKLKELHDAIIFGIKNYFLRTGFKKAFIGVSGGIDSALTLYMTVKALGKDDVTAVMMPSMFTSRKCIEDAKELAKKLGVKMIEVPITDTFVTLKSSLKDRFKGRKEDLTEENMQARLRSNILMSLSNKFKALVLATSNKTEVAIGYSTLYGDAVGAVAPIADVSKQKVYQLTRYINKKKDIIPKSIINKAPTAELKKDQTDEKSIGIPYKVLSPLVDDIIENNCLSRYKKSDIIKVKKMIKNSEYKRRQFPPIIKVTKKTFGIGRRYFI